MSASFFAVDAVGFWVLLLMGAVLVSWLIDEAFVLSATVAALMTFVVLVFASGLHPVSMVLDHPVLAAVAVPVYLVAGAGWAILKWKLFVRSLRRRVDAVTEVFRERMDKEVQGSKDFRHRIWMELLTVHKVLTSLTLRSQKAKCTPTERLRWLVEVCLLTVIVLVPKERHGFANLRRRFQRTGWTVAGVQSRPSHPPRSGRVSPSP